MADVYAREPRWDPARFPPADPAPRIVQTLRAQRDPVGYTLSLRRALGPVFTWRVLPNRSGFVCAADAETSREVLTDQDRFVGGEAAALLEPLLGARSLITTPPPRHLRNRRLLLPPFHGERIARWTDRVAALAAERAPRLVTGEPVAVRPWAQDLTLDVILRVVFGVEDPARLVAMRRAMDALMAPASMAILFAPRALRRDRGRASPGGRFVRRLAAVHALVDEEVSQRRARLDRHEDDDVLSVLLGVRDEDGAGLTDAELRDELMGLLIAGHETTATGLAWALHLLAHHPSARDELLADLDAGGDELLAATIKEVLRLRSPVLGAVRNATRDTTLGGRPVPKGAFVMALYNVVQLDPALWDQPQAFRPRRHLEGAPAPYSHTPFGGGVRRCLGAALAQLELEVVLRELLRRAVPEAVGAEEGGRQLAVTVIPARGGRVRMRPRGGGPRGDPLPPATGAQPEPAAH